MIEIKLKNIIESVPVLQRISLEEMPVVTAFKVMRILREAQSSLEDYNRGIETLKRRYEGAEDKTQAWEDELKELGEVVVKINESPIKVEELGNVKLRPIDALNLAALIE